MKIGLFGGTFDPIHFGHIKLAENAYNLYHLDYVDFIPSGNSYLKRDVSDSNIRFQMTKLALENYENFNINEIELQRQGPSYSYETILSYRQQFPDDELFFIIGEDSVRNIHLWKNIETIFNECKIIVAGRKKNSDLDQDMRSVDLNNIIKNLNKRYNAEIFYFEYDVSISSSEIRKICKECNLININEKLKEYVPSNVIDYIKTQKIYCEK